MITALFRYITLFILTLLVLSALSFSLAYLFPGDPLVNMSGITPQNPLQRDALISQYGLDKPYIVQFGYFLERLWEGNWGYSFVSGRPLKEELIVALPATIELSAYALLVSLVLGIGLGCLAGLRAYSTTDLTLNSLSIFSYSFPVYWLALLFILVFSLQLGIVPLSGRISLMFDIPSQTGFILIDILMADNIDRKLAFSDALQHLMLPTLSIAIITTASIIRLMRRSVIDVLNKPYIAAARSRGLSRWKIFSQHILRNSLLPILPLMAIQVTTLITNAMIVETLFSWPGVGNWLLQAIYQRDYCALQIGMLAVSFVVITLTIAIDFFNRLIDPSRDKFDRGTV